MLLFNVNQTITNNKDCNDELIKDIPTRNMNSSNVKNKLRIQDLTKEIISSLHFLDYSELVKPPFIVSWPPTIIW